MSDNRLGPPPVEPLSDVAWARVERGLWTRLDNAPRADELRPEPRPSRSRWWLVVPAVAAAAIALVVITRGDDEHGQDSTVETADVRVVAPPTASTTATFDDAHIELAPASAVVMRRDRPITVLERGSAWFSVAPRIDRPAFTVLAGDATVRVLGTRFRVARSDERITVEVDHGRVEVQYRDRVQFLGAHQTWSSGEPERVVLLDTTTQPGPAPEPPARVDPVDPPPRTTPTPPPPPKIKQPRVEPKPKPTAKLDPIDPNPTPPDRPSVAQEQARFEQLATLEKTNPKAALAGYLEISRRGSRWAANALFAAGRLAFDHKDPRAETLLTVYLKRFPNSPNADDARALLARLKR